MIEVLGVAGESEVARFVLQHGADPSAVLLSRGWSGTPVAASRPAPGSLLIRYAVKRAGASGDGRSAARAVPLDAGLAADDLAGAHRNQRVAAYAVVHSALGVLLTELSPRTNAAGLWNLPGGGIEPDEEPAAAVEREVDEETGQQVTGVRLLTVLTNHWVGRSPAGRVEDFHAVRLFHTATAPVPSAPVVHDRGGSTSDARWVAVEDLAQMPLAASVPEALAAAGIWAPPAAG